MSFLRRAVAGEPSQAERLDLIVFSRQLAIFVRGGIPVIDGVRVVREQAISGHFRKTLDDVAARLQEGMRLSDALGRHPEVFFDLYVEMIHAAEETGELDAMLDQLARYLETSQATAASRKRGRTLALTPREARPGAPASAGAGVLGPRGSLGAATPAGNGSDPNDVGREDPLAYLGPALPARPVPPNAQVAYDELVAKLRSGPVLDPPTAKPVRRWPWGTPRGAAHLSGAERKTAKAEAKAAKREQDALNRATRAANDAAKRAARAAAKEEQRLARVAANEEKRAQREARAEEQRLRRVELAEAKRVRQAELAEAKRVKVEERNEAKRLEREVKEGEKRAELAAKAARAEAKAAERAARPPRRRFKIPGLETADDKRSVAGGGSWRERNFSSLQKVKRIDLIIFSRQMATFIRAGIPIIDGIRVVREQTRSSLFRRTLDEVVALLESGEPLSAALAQHPRVFSELYIDMVVAAEATGELDAILDQLAKYMERSDATARQMKQAMLYPTIVLGLACIVVFILMVVVLPSFVALFADFDAVLPLPTQILLALGAFGGEYGIATGGVVVILLTALFLVRNTGPLKRFRQKVMLRLPVLGNIVRLGIETRFARTLSILHKAGVPISQSFEIAATGTGNHIYQRALRPVRDALIAGEGISGPLSDSKLFGPLLVQMVKVGEETGTLDRYLDEAATFLDDELTYRTKQMVTIIEPLMILGVAGIVGFVALSVITPMYSILHQIK